MPKRHRHRHRHRNRTMKGGVLDNLSNTLSSWGSSLSQGASNIWEKAKNATSGLTNSTPYTNSYSNNSYQSPQTNSYQPAPMSSSSYGGKHSRRRRHMRGGFKDNTPTTGIAVNAEPVSNSKTAQPHNWVGGRTRRRGRKTRRH
jgi:hypothetical protein